MLPAVVPPANAQEAVTAVSKVLSFSQKGAVDTAPFFFAHLPQPF